MNGIRITINEAAFAADHRRALVDIHTILEALHDEAEDRDWCDEYFSFLRQLSDQLLTVDIAERKRTVNVDMSFAVDADYTTSGLEEELHRLVHRHAGDYASSLADVSIDITDEED